MGKKANLNWYYHDTVECKKCGRRYEIEFQKTIMRDRSEIACHCGETIFSDSGAAFYRATPVGHSEKPDYLK